MSEHRTDPARADVVVRSRALPDHNFLAPPADFPALFTCRTHGVPAVGCVYRSGVVCVVPDTFGNYWATPVMFSSMRAVDRCDYITDVVWEWGVTRLAAAINAL